MLAAAALSACGADPYLELQIADPDLPFLISGVDFDTLVVEARKEGCAASETRYPARDLPASLTILPGDCYAADLELRASALLAERRVAASAWIDAAFPGSGAAVVTATLADVEGARLLFATGFERGEPFGDADSLTISTSTNVRDLNARVTTEGPLTGERSAELSGEAINGNAKAYARVAAMNVVLARGDQLVFNFELASDSVLRAAGVDLELSTGTTAETLMLVNREMVPIHPSSAQSREPGVKQLWTVDLSAAAGVRLVGVLLAIDPRGQGSGRFEVRIDDLAVVRP